MKYLFDALSKDFFPLLMKREYVASGTWPAKGVEVDEELFCEFLYPPSGKGRGADQKGYPIWVELPPLKDEQKLILMESEKAKRKAIAVSTINNHQWAGKASIGRLNGNELEKYNRWLDYLDALETVDTSSTADITWPQAPFFDGSAYSESE